MKKYLILSYLVLFAFVAIAQERTVNNKATIFKTDVTYLEYNGVAADTLIKTNQDTIDFIFTNQNHFAVEKLIFSCSFDSIAGNDSIYYFVNGYNNLLGAGTTITTGGALINASNEIVDIAKWYWTNDTTFVDLNYRYYKLRFIQDGNTDYDGGASVNYIKAKLYLK